jgi:hypothetical protein
MLVTTERLVWVECVRSRIFRGSLQFTPGFCLSPLTASPSCCSRHHIVPSFVLSTFNSHHNLGAAVTRSFRPPFCFNSGGTPKFRERRTPKRDRQKRALWQFQYVRGFQQSGGRCRYTVKDCADFIGGLISSLGGRNRPRYCVSNARRAAATVGPMPTMPSSIVGPSSAIQRSLRKNS